MNVSIILDSINTYMNSSIEVDAVVYVNTRDTVFIADSDDDVCEGRILLVTEESGLLKDIMDDCPPLGGSDIMYRIRCKITGIVYFTYNNTASIKLTDYIVLSGTAS
jgi:hypothetical protein